MAYTRIKKITEEERAARAQLRKMGVSEYDLQRLYDANYKARQRATVAGASYGESLNLNWKNILQGARQARGIGKTVSEYITARTQAYKGKYKLKEVKREQVESITGGTGDDWGAELVSRELKKYSTAEVVNLKAEAIDDMEENGEALPPISNETYKRAHQRYIETNSSTQSEWDNLLNEERAKDIEESETLLNYIANLIGIDLDGIRRAQAEAEQIAAGLPESERDKFLQRKKREAFSIYRGV